MVWGHLAAVSEDATVQVGGVLDIQQLVEVCIYCWVSRVCSWSDVYDNLGHFRPSFVHGDVSRGMDEREGAYC